MLTDYSPPQTVADSYTTAENQTLVGNDAFGTSTTTANDNGVLANDNTYGGYLTVYAVSITVNGTTTTTRLMGNTITVTTALGGSFTVNTNGTFTYVPPHDIDGLDGNNVDTFNLYTASDGQRQSDLTPVQFYITDTPPVVTASNLNATENASTGNVVVGHFTSPSASTNASKFSASIHWGDGVTSAANISYNSTTQAFDVSASHTYTEEGSYTTGLTITDTGGGATASASGTATVADAALTATGINVSTIKGNVFNGPVATFTDPGSDGTTADYSATITWGDGNSSSATISPDSNGDGGFTVNGTNTYANAGSSTINVSISDAGGSTTTASSTATIALAAPGNLQAIVNSTSEIDLAWSAVSGATSYNVYRSTTSGGEGAQGGTPIGTSTTTAFADTGLTAGTTYYYQVTAVNGTSGQSAPSTESFATLPNTTPTFTFTGPTTITEGVPYTLHLSASETNSSWIVNWGDGTPDAPDTVPYSNTSAVSHTYTDGATDLTISATATTGPHDIFNATAEIPGGFGSSGIATTSLHAVNATGEVLQADGKIIVSGTSTTIATDGSTINQFTLSRYYSDGTPDSTFGNNGIVYTSFGNSASANDIALQSDSKIVVVGATLASPNRFALARYNANGTLDTTFGNGLPILNGKVTTAITGGGMAYSVAIQSNGQIIAAGSDGTNFILVRYNANGHVDTNFGTNGIVTTVIAAGSKINALAIQPDGQILAAGSDAHGDVLLARYNTDGSLDTSFGVRGIVTASGAGVVNQLALQSNGQIVVASGGRFSSTLLRYDADGSEDTSFDSNAAAVSASGQYTAVTLQSDGKIIAAGNDGGGNFIISRYNTDGTLDANFDTTGTTTTILNAAGSASRVIVQPDGKIVAAGYDATGDFLVARYNPDGSLDAFTPASGVPVHVNRAAPTIDDSNQPSIVANSYAGTSVGLTVLGSDIHGESNLTYTWSVDGAQPGNVFFSDAADNSAQDVTAYFDHVGTYSLKVTITNDAGLTVISRDVAVTVVSTPTSIAVAPAVATIQDGTTQEFIATEDDQFGNPMDPPTSGFTWTKGTNDLGTIDSTGQYTAPSIGAGLVTVTATDSTNNITGSSTLNFAALPTVTAAASAAQTTITGTFVDLTVSGADASGEPNLTYTWAATTDSPEGTSFSDNGTNTAKNTTATFTQAGTYDLQVTIANDANLTVTSDVVVTVNESLASIAVSPNSSWFDDGSTLQFAATAENQFNNPMANQPTSFTWSIGTTDAGSIDPNTGLYTAPTTGDGSATVTATTTDSNGNAVTRYMRRLLTPSPNRPSCRPPATLRFKKAPPTL